MDDFEVQSLMKAINSCVISDILDDIGVDGVISGLVPNMPETKIFGRTCTLKIRKLNENEDYRGIYSALSSYNQIKNNDIIVVENECAEYAYFGELNCSLAIRSGAKGAIIGGKTRDAFEVLAQGFPVFSTGYNCKDVRKRATLDSINEPIVIQKITIEPGCMIFADVNGIVVIPKSVEAEVLSRIQQKVTLENNVSAAIKTGLDPLNILRNIGEF